MDRPPKAEETLDLPVGELIRAWREFRGWTLTQLAARADLKKGHVSEIETGKIARPNRATLKRLAQALMIDEWSLHTRQRPPHETAGASGEDDPPGRCQAVGGFNFAAPVPFGDAPQKRDVQLERLSRLVDEMRAAIDDLLPESRRDGR